MKDKLSNKSYYNAAIAFVGLLAAILTIYAFFFQKNENRIQYEIITNSNVLDINTNISKLDIVYDSTSLKDKNQNLRVISIRIKNVGNTNILKTFYDNVSPLGVQINDGYIVENPEILETSNDYLKANLKAIKKNDSIINFANVILDKSEFYEIKLLVLHELNQTPSLTAIGKIAGINHIQIINSSEVEADIPFFTKSFSGNIFIQLTRGIAYFIIIVILIGASVGISEFISSKRKKRKKRKLIHLFEDSTGYKSKRIHDVIFDNFEDDGLRTLKRKFSVLTDEEELNISVKRWDEIQLLKEEKEKIVKGHVDIEGITLPNGFKASWKDEKNSFLIEQMSSEGFIVPNGDKLMINKELKKTLEDFIEHLKRHNYREESNHKTFIETDGELRTVIQE